ncbi:MAG: flippase-like domain-containing protein, partial [Candidatus Fibromonas sp.]|nr:flippase-like domain-containing protein [Candidatus Fibromonas sp.]
MKGFLIFLFKLLVSAVLCFFVWKSIVSTSGMDSDGFVTIMKNVNFKYLSFAVFFIFLSYLSGCLQWKRLLAAQNIEMTYVDLLRFYFVGCFFNNFMPGNVGGDLKKIYDINQNSNETVGAAISATFLDRLCGLYTLCGFALAVGVVFFWRDPGQRFFLFPSLIVFLSFSLGLCMLFSIRFGNLLFGKILFFLNKRVLHLYGRFQTFKTKRLFAQLFVFSTLTQSLRIFSHYLCALSIGVDISVSWYFYYIPIIAIVSALPISIGGFGPRELMAQTLFTRIGVGSLEAVIMQLLAYVANLA